MKQLVCPNCNGRYRYEHSKGWVCDCCGNVVESLGGEQGLSDINIETLNVANGRRMEDYDFDGSLDLCKQILKENPDIEEANWSALLAEYKVVYQKNSEGKYVATFLDPNAKTPITSSQYYVRLSEKHRREADEIENMRKLVLSESATIADFDVFISYKQHKNENNNEETKESLWAEEVYQLLSKPYKGTRLRVFYDKELLDKSNAGWEPHIYSALKSSKFMVLLGSSLENICSPWVKNEWKRFVSYKRSGDPKTIAVIGSGFAPERLPDIALKEKQMLDINGDWKEKLLKRAHNACDFSDGNSLMDMANQYIQKKKFGKAKSNFNKILENDPKNSYAYWGLLKCKLKAFDDYDIIKSSKAVNKFEEFNYAVRYANEEDRKYYLKIQSAQVNHDVIGQDRTNYKAYRNFSKKKKIITGVVTVLCVLTISAGGLYGYTDYSHPFKYDILQNGIVLNDTGFMYKLFKRELSLDKYEEKPIIEIGANALEGAKLKIVTLGNSVKTIGEKAFANNNKLTTVNIQSDTINIGSEAFLNCKNLSEVNFVTNDKDDVGISAVSAREVTPSGEIIIGNGAFSGCTSLNSIVLNNVSSIGARAFEGCSNLKNIYINSRSGLTIGKGAFDGASDSLVISIPSVEEDLYNSLKQEYEHINFSTYTRDAVEEVEYFISKLGDIDKNSLEAIEKAEALYNALSDSDKAKISIYNNLVEARLIYEVVAVIEQIGEVTLDSEDKIKEAENVYNRLSGELKKRVANKQVLIDSRAVFEVMKLVANIGDINLNSGEKIQEADSKYNELNSSQRSQVSNYETLVFAKQVYNVLKLVNDIGTVTINSGMTIKEAEDAYDKLTLEQRELITNYSDLTNARAVYDVMFAINNLNGTITMQSKTSIENAGKAFDALIKELQPRVSNYEDLQIARKIYETVKLIDDIGTVTLENEEPILTAENSYNLLLENERARVGNYVILTDARSIYNVIKLISEIGEEISINSLNAIQRAEEAYGELTNLQKNKVSNYETLQKARMAYDVCETIELIKNLGTINENSKSAIEQAEAAYNKLTQSQRMQVTNYNVLQEARLVYDVIYKISLIEKISIDSKSAIQDAERAYKLLRQDLQSKVTNYSLLEDAQKIYNVVELIDKIGTITKDSGTKIKTAENAFNELNGTQQARVSNSSFLSNARPAYEVVLLIDNIGEINSESRTEINNAKKRYEQLTSEQRNLVSNYSVLQNALDELTIYDVIDKIKQIGTVTLSSANIITEAESAYNSLGKDKQARVTNYNTLKDARAIYDLMLAIKSIGTVKFGKGTSYSYKTVSESTMVNVLNDSTVRKEIDSITLTGIVTITPEVWTNAMPNLTTVRYDLSNSSINSYKVPAGKLTYCLVGTTTKTYNMQVTVSVGEEVHLAFDNFKLKYSSYPLDTTNASKAYVKFLGTNTITATDAGASAINAKNLEITLSNNSNTTISGANGAESIDGGNGINVSQLNIYGTDSSTLTVNGGNGVDGADGIDGEEGKQGTSVQVDYGNTRPKGGKGTDGTDGTDGEDGTNGGNAVTASKIDINGGTYIFTSGQGGNGGNGGNGGKGGGGGQHNCGSAGGGGSAGDGGTGGKGGNGGQGGNGGKPMSCKTITLKSCNVKMNSGKGGDGGKGGAGGEGGHGGWSRGWAWTYGTGGNGGQGGNGGNAGNGGNVYKVTGINKDYVSNVTESLNDVGKGQDTGGNGGLAGGAGTADGSGKNGSPGTPGEPGEASSDGKILS